MERERRTFQLQMCEVGGLVAVTIPWGDSTFRSRRHGIDPTQHKHVVGPAELKWLTAKTQIRETVVSRHRSTKMVKQLTGTSC